MSETLVACSRHTTVLTHRGWLAAAALVILTACSSNQVYFSDEGNLQDLVKAEIEAAEVSVHVAVYTFTSEVIRDGLITAQARGVDVKVCADAGQELNRDILRALEDAGVTVGTTAGYEPGGIMHHKFLVLDEKRVLTGSFNFTPSADDRNAENLLFLADPALALRYQGAFETLWERCDAS